MRIRIFLVLLLIAPAALAQTDAAMPASSCCAPMPPGLTAWWAFDPAGAPSQDRIPPNNVANHLGGPTAQPGMVNQALCFDGKGAYAEAADHPDLDFAGACTASEPIFIDFWIRTTSSSGVTTVLDKRDRSPSARGWSVYLHNGRPGLQIATGTGPESCGAWNNAAIACTNDTAPVSIADGNWHFVAFRVSPRCGANARGSIFVDGNLVHSFTPRQGDIANAAPLSIGRRLPLFGQTFFNGCLDELEIGKRPLTDAQILAIYNAGRRGKCF